MEGLVVMVMMMRAAGGRAEGGGEDGDGHEQSAPDPVHCRSWLRSDW
jgi:hypothetical protein